MMEEALPQITLERDRHPAVTVEIPSPAQSSVLAQWLVFDQIGLPNSVISVLLGEGHGEVKVSTLFQNRMPCAR